MKRFAKLLKAYFSAADVHIDEEWKKRKKKKVSVQKKFSISFFPFPNRFPIFSPSFLPSPPHQLSTPSPTRSRGLYFQLFPRPLFSDLTAVKFGPNLNGFFYLFLRLTKFSSWVSRLFLFFFIFFFYYKYFFPSHFFPILFRFPSFSFPLDFPVKDKKVKKWRPFTST